MWTWHQRTGTATRNSATLRGYSGASQAKNDPSRQSEHNVGPIPCGHYLIGSPIDTTTHGPFVLPLTPNPQNEMFGRGGFLIHADSIVHPGAASEGCICLGPADRRAIHESGDCDLVVVPE